MKGYHKNTIADFRNRRIKSVLSHALVLVAIAGQLLLHPNTVHAAVAVLDPFPATPQINNATTSPQTTTFTPSSGANRLIVIEVTNIPGNTTVTGISVVYGSNNVPATYVVGSANNQRRQAWLFYLTEADITSAADNTLTVTNNNAAGGFSVNIAAFSGVDQTSPVTAFGGQYINNTASILNYPAALNVNAGGYGIIAAGSNTSGGTIGESYTDHGETTIGAGFSRLGSKAIATAGTTDPGITYGANVRAGAAGMTLNPAPAGSPGSLQFSTSDYSISENGGLAVLSVTRTGGSSGSVGLSYQTTDGTATGGSDYTAGSGTLSWPDGDTADKTIAIAITNDTAAEVNETFTVALSGPSGGAVLGSAASATVTIGDDDSGGGPQVPAGNALLFMALAGGMAYLAARKKNGKKE